MALIRLNNQSISSVTALPSGIDTGKVLQVVQASATSGTTSTSSTYSDATGLSATITPSSTSNKIFIICSLQGCLKSDSNTSLNARLLRGGTSLHNFGGSAGWDGGTGINSIGTISTTTVDSPSTTSATTYKVQISSQNNSANVRINWYEGSPTSHIVLMEIEG